MGNKKERKRVKHPVRVILITLLVVAVLLVGGYQLLRYPDAMRNLKDNTLSEEQTIELKDELLKKDNARILIAYFSYSGTTKEVAESLHDRIGGDLFEIKTTEEYSNVYVESNWQIRRNRLPELTEKIDNMVQ